LWKGKRVHFTDPSVATVYADYEARNAVEQERQRTLGASGFAMRDEFLLPVGPEVGAFLHSLILARKPKRILELGTSYGYSTLFLADAARAVGATVITIELADFKHDHAKGEIARAGLSGVVDFRLGDAVALIEADAGPFDFILLDIWKELYLPCFDAFYGKLSEEAIIAADNMIYPPQARDDVRKYRAAVQAKDDLQTMLLPIGSGIELTVKWVAGSASL
jgi:predicted O-methyltransferase YrrM